MSVVKISRFGWKRDHLDTRDQHLTVPEGLVLPSQFDQRVKPETEGSLPPVYDQMQLGSCTANAGAAAIDFERKHQGLPFLTPSRQFIYYNTRALEGTTGFDAGGEVRDVIKTLVAQGVCPESQWPYERSNLTEKPTAECYAAALKFEALNYSRVNQTKYALKYALSQKKRPVQYGMSVYEQIESDQAAKDGVITMPSASAEPIGGHAVCLVGYNDVSSQFIFRNSWGAAWGDAGYGYIPYDYILNADLCSDFWIILADKISL